MPRITITNSSKNPDEVFFVVKGSGDAVRLVTGDAVDIDLLDDEQLVIGGDLDKLPVRK